ncbi:hypothetical protein GBA52_027375 [Prunus armeniaca]|nr:hypothetical protein GBA52_027375 [Prunus armeniaca]
MILSIDGDNTTKERICYAKKRSYGEKKTRHPEHEQTTPADMKLKKQNSKEHKPAYEWKQRCNKEEKQARRNA